jgi:tRNA nucleotidyltransferase/poly(A) polymerase
MKLSPANAPWLFDGPAARLLAVLDRDSEEARAVGGAVRNALLGLAVAEIDVATTARPEVVTRRVTEAGFHAVPTGIDHGTVTVVVEGKPFEVTTLRQDIETDGRHATVRFGREWARDAARRDFTMNALYASRDGNVFDFTGGVADLKSRRVRFIGDADARIAEDYLRILRFFRFHAAYGEGPPDAEGLAACIAAREGLSLLSRERVRNELMKLSVARHAVGMLAVMSESGILIDVLGGVPWLASFSNIMKAEEELGLAADPVRRLGALAVRVREDAERLRDRLRLTNEETRRLRMMGEGWWRMAPDMGENTRRVVLYRIGPEAYRDRVLVAFSRSQEKVDDEHWRALIDLPQQWTAPKFPLAAKHFLDMGVKKGPALGSILARAEESWTEHGFPQDYASLMAIRDWAIAQESASA